MDFRQSYEIWLKNDYFDEETRKELELISDDDREIEDRFYRELEFGTGGMRGLIGAGTNRINRYMVRKAAQGLANYVKKQSGESGKGVAIAFDSRHFSKEFAFETALVLASNGIKSYVFESLRSTPELSFTVRHLGCAAGVVITASHNPKEYNGFKAYGSDGCQLPPRQSDEVIREVESISDIASIGCMSRTEAEDRGLLTIIGSEVDDAYIEAVKRVRVNPAVSEGEGKTSKIIYTPLHGSGNIPVMRVLRETGFENVLVVKEQEMPDPDFSTVKYPNPEERAAFNLAIEMASKENVDLIIGTDPDADRVGVVVRNSGGEYMTLTGNQTGCLLLEYILSQKKRKNELPENAFICSTIVSSDMAKAIAKNYGVEFIAVLTGFKFIGEQIRFLDDTGKKKFIFGFEESYGYLAGTHARDKDAVVATMLIAEMFAWYRQRGMNLYDGLIELFGKYGYYSEGIDSFTLKGKEGMEKIGSAMDELRSRKPRRFGNSEVCAVSDYLVGKRIDLSSGNERSLTLPKSNVLYFEFRSGFWFCIRPSGTEPKIKIYYGVSADSLGNAESLLGEFKKDVMKVIKPLLE